MSAVIEVVVRFKCRHQKLEPHRVGAFHYGDSSSLPEMEDSWCPGGYSITLDRAHLESLIREELEGQHPRMTRAETPVKARQIVDGIHALVADPLPTA